MFMSLIMEQEAEGIFFMFYFQSWKNETSSSPHCNHLGLWVFDLWTNVNGDF